MKRHVRDSSRFFNPARLADEAVLALSSIERGREVSLEFLKEGIELCDYLVSLLGEASPQPERGRWAFHRTRDREALQESEIDIDIMRAKVEQAKEALERLIQDPSSHDAEQIGKTQERLMTLTMPLWRNRTSEFRERKLKRGLSIHG